MPMLHPLLHACADLPPHPHIACPPPSQLTGEASCLLWGDHYGANLEK